MEIYGTGKSRNSLLRLKGVTSARMTRKARMTEGDHLLKRSENWSGGLCYGDNAVCLMVAFLEKRRHKPLADHVSIAQLTVYGNLTRYLGAG